LGGELGDDVLDAQDAEEAVLDGEQALDKGFSLGGRDIGVL